MRLRLLVSEAWRSLGANISTTFAATMTVLVGMFLLGLFIAFGTYVVSWSNHVKSGLIVKVEFKTTPQATRQQENAVARLLSANPTLQPLVKHWRFVPKAEGLKEMEKSDPALTKDLPYNPLPDEFTITPSRGEDVNALTTDLQKMNLPGVDKVEDSKELSNRVLRVAHWIELIFVIATAILLISATMLIANTIRLSIFSRRREIEVMKLVGATNWFIRGPFMIEGLLCGVFGALLAVLCLVLGKAIVLPAITDHNALSNDPTVHALAFPLTAVVLVGMGLMLGGLGSGLTLRRFLQV